MGNTNEGGQLIGERIARKTPIMVVSTRFGEWPLYGLSTKRPMPPRLSTRDDPPRRVAAAGGYPARNLTGVQPEAAA
jgi:hypothetical protein